MKNILVAIDDCQKTTIASPLIVRVIELANAFSSKVRLLHVVPQSQQPPFNIDKKTLRHEVAHELHDEHEFLQQLAKHLRNRDIDATSLLVKGAIIKTILHESDRLGVDLIILGRHKHSKLYSALINGTEEGLLKICPYPIMFVPTSE
ncbi:MAG: universal stress protein [Gammaproteobacteria bacterium]|nr:universal stress protein [Gammaproteobacteria bacterium]